VAIVTEILAKTGLKPFSPSVIKL